MKKYELQDVKEPNLLRDQFPYSDVPRIVLDGERVPMNLPEDYWITCTTFRDGQQARPPYTVKQTVDLYDLLHRLGGPNGVIRQSEFFLYSDKDKQAVNKCLEKGHKFPEVTGWIRAVKSDFQLVKQMGLKETGVLTSSSDYHVFLKLKKTRQQAMDSYVEIVEEALSNNIRVRCHLEDITRADFYGFVIPFVQRLKDISDQSSLDVPIKIRLCDTMGYGLPYPEVALPRSIPKLVHGIVNDGGFPPERLEWHGHNDFHKVLVNAACAWLYGCCAANGTLLGFGERTGNPPIEGLVIEYMGLKGDSCGMDTTVITEIAEYFRKEIGAFVPDNYPFVGRDFNVTRAGIHADGVVKSQEIYNIFDTGKLLNRPLGTAVTDKSGLAGIALWVDLQLGLTGDKKISKKDPGIAEIAEWVKEQYDKKRTTAISPEEMMEQAKKHLPQYFK
jgi:isopropylmalate/homocitrate/citramalate synthase